MTLTEAKEKAQKEIAAFNDSRLSSKERLEVWEDDGKFYCAVFYYETKKRYYKNSSTFLIDFDNKQIIPQI